MKINDVGISIRPSEASVLLQNLIDHTTKRIIEYLKFDTATQQQKLILIIKWGADGSSNHSRLDFIVHTKEITFSNYSILL